MQAIFGKLRQIQEPGILVLTKHIAPSSYKTLIIFDSNMFHMKNSNVQGASVSK